MASIAATVVMSVSSSRLDALDNRGNALAAADAERDQGRCKIAPLKLVERCAEEYRPGGAERVAEGDRSAVDIDFRGVQFQAAHRLERDGGKCFVDFPQVNVMYR